MLNTFASLATRPMSRPNPHTSWPSSMGWWQTNYFSSSGLFSETATAHQRPDPRRPPYQPLPHQTPPAGEAWDTWLLVAGRGAGKTRAASELVLAHLRRHGPRARVGIGAPALADARDVCAEGESGLLACGAGEFPTYHRSIGYCEARHRDGGYVRFMGSESPKRWNGPQWSLVWWDEWCLINFESYRASQFGLRLGQTPRMLITTTPKAIAMTELRALVAHDGVVTSHARSDDNPHLSARRRAELARDYGDTTLGRMELLGELVYDTEGALWQHAWIEQHRVREAPELVRVAVAVDPAGGQGNQSAQTGIAAGGLGADGHAYVTHLEGVQLSPLAWFLRACDLYDAVGADCLVVEQNYGGPFIRELAREHRPDVHVVFVSATRGKVVRAEPIAARYQKGDVHHVGLLAEGEAQLCSFPLARRKDMADAAVWLVTHLLHGRAPVVAPLSMGRVSPWRFRG